MNYRVPAETVRLDLQPGVVVGRRIDLDIIFRNLIDNAVKYAATPPRVEVSLRPAADGQVLVRIADNGRGIPRTCGGKSSAASSGWDWNWSARSPAPAWGCTSPGRSCAATAAKSASMIPSRGRGRCSRCNCREGKCKLKNANGIANRGSVPAIQAIAICNLQFAQNDDLQSCPTTNTSWSSKTKSTWPRASSTTWWPRAIG